MHGDIEIKGEYIERCARAAKEKGGGIAVLHSHPAGRGPQGMSVNDYRTEESFAPFVYAVTGKHLVGVTLSGDEKWSGRVWVKHSTKKRTYNPAKVTNFRVVGENKISLIQNTDELNGTIDSTTKDRIQVSVASYGEKNQKVISNLKIGIVGLGSVGSAVAESLVRIGVRYITLCDHDSIEDRNLDRLTNVTINDINKKKVSVIKERLDSIGIHEEIFIGTTTEKFLHKNMSFKKMLDCDLVFCCVDNIDARIAINKLAFWYLVPVIETGITLIPKEKDGKIEKIQQILLLVHTLVPGFQCLQCAKQCIEQEQYMQSNDENYKNKGKENIFPMSTMVASMAVLNMIHIISGEKPCSRFESWSFGLEKNETEFKNEDCDKSKCLFANQIGDGDK